MSPHRMKTVCRICAGRRVFPSAAPMVYDGKADGSAVFGDNKGPRLYNLIMNIFGIQKLTLLDFPGAVACTIFTGGCNLRCPFCHNASLVLGTAEGGTPESEVLAFLSKRNTLLDGICVSGGEPLMHPDLPEFLRKAKALNYRIKLDTNGCFPDALRDIVSRGLVDYVAMDIKNAPERYAETVGVPGFDLSPVRESIAFLLSSAVDYEFRTTVVRGLHTRESLQGAAQSIEGAERYYLQKFVDSGDLVGENLSAFSDAEMQSFLPAVSPYVKTAKLRGL